LRRTHRISAGAIVLDQEKLLLVRYGRKDGNSFLAGPGGGVHMREGLTGAVVREVREETGLEVNPFPCRVLLVEEFLSQKHRHIKIWLLCRLVRGEMTKTREAEKEGIIEVGWYSRSELENEEVYPSLLSTSDWPSFLENSWETRYLELHKANF